MRSEEDVRRYLRLVRAMDRGMTAIGQPKQMIAEVAVLKWMLGEQRDPPGLNLIDDLEKAAATLEAMIS